MLLPSLLMAIPRAYLSPIYFIFEKNNLFQVKLCKSLQILVVFCTLVLVGWPILFFETEFQHVTQAGHECIVLLPQPPERQDYKHMLPQSVLPILFLFLFIPFLYLCVHVSVYVCVCACVVQTTTLGVFLDHSPPQFLRQTSSLKLELGNSSRLSGQ